MLSPSPGSTFFIYLRKDEKRQFEYYDDQGKTRRIRRDRDNAPTGPRGGRGAGRRPPRDQPAEKKEAESTPTPAQ